MVLDSSLRLSVCLNQAQYYCSMFFDDVWRVNRIQLHFMAFRVDEYLLELGVSGYFDMS